MGRSIDESEIMENIYKRMWNDELDMGVIGRFEEEDQPSEDKPTHTKGISPEEGEEEEEKEVDEEVEPSGEEGEGGEVESFENFKEEHKTFSDTLKGYREAFENEFNYYAGLAKARLDKGVDLL